MAADTAQAKPSRRNTGKDRLSKNELCETLNALYNQCTELTRQLSDARLPINNNECEQAVKQAVPGSKNWLFAFETTASSRATTGVSIANADCSDARESHGVRPPLPSPPGDCRLHPSDSRRYTQRFGTASTGRNGALRRVYTASRSESRSCRSPAVYRDRD